MIDLRSFLFAIALPALLMAMSLLIAYAGRAQWPALASLPGIGVAAAFAIAMASLNPDVRLLAPQGWGWLFWIALAVAGAALVEMLLFNPNLLLALGILGALGAMALLGSGRITERNGWSASEFAGWVAISAAAAAVSWLSAVGSQGECDARTPAVTLAITSLTAAAVIGFVGHSEKLALIGIIQGVCAVMLALFVLSFPRTRISPITWMAITLLSVAVTTAALEPWYASLPMADGLLVLAAPVAAWAGLLAPRGRGWISAALAAAVAVLILAVPIVHVIQTVISYRQDGFM